MVRDRKPLVVTELGSFGGWSTTWLLHALRDNQAGTLFSFDKLDDSTRNVPPELAADRWKFVQGDIRHTFLEAAPEPDYLFIDAAHSARFARWYLERIFPEIRPGVIISIHDVYHYRFTLPFHEGRAVIRWLQRNGADAFTCSSARSLSVFNELNDLRAELEIPAVRGVGKNPMVLFDMPLRE